MITFNQTLQNIKADISRRQQLESRDNQRVNQLKIVLMRGVMSVILYRLSHFCAQHRLILLAKILFSTNNILFRNEISPQAKLGAGLVLTNNGGIGVSQVVRAGKNCTFLGMNTLTLGVMKGFDLNQDLIELGDYCVLGMRSRIMRPVKISDFVQIKHNSLVMLPESKIGSVLSGVPAKRRAIVIANDVMHFNPLRGVNMQMSGATESLPS